MNIITPIVSPAIQALTKIISKKLTDSEVELGFRRMLSIELRANISLLDVITRSCDENQLCDSVAMATVSQLQTEVCRIAITGVGVPLSLSATIDEATSDLIFEKEEWLKGRASQGGETPIFSDLLDFLIRKDIEMKAIAKISNDSKMPTNVKWKTRLNGFKNVAIIAKKALHAHTEKTK